jgi:hypothetical protein
MVNCVKAAALADWIYWTQSADLSSQVATHFGQTVASTSSVMKKVWARVILHLFVAPSSSHISVRV